LVKTNDSRKSAIVLVYGIFGLINEERNNNHLNNESTLSIFNGVSKIQFPFT